MAQSIALVRPDGLVETFIRLDYPEGWKPEEGYTLVPDDELPEGWKMWPGPVPESVSPRQLRIWLVRAGISIESVDAAIAAIPDATEREVAKIEWEFSPYYERNNMMLRAIAESLGLSEEQVDQAFREASQI